MTPPTAGAIEIERGGDENTTINHGDRRYDDGVGRHDDDDGRHNNSKGRHGDGKRQQGDRRYDDGKGQHDDGDGRHGDSKGRHGDGKRQQGDRRRRRGDGEASTRQRRGKTDAKAIGYGAAGGRDNKAINKRKQIIDKYSTNNNQTLTHLFCLISA